MNSERPSNISTPAAVANGSTASTPSREYQTRLKRMHALLEDPTSTTTAEGEEGGIRASRRLSAKSSPLSSARATFGASRGPGIPGYGHGHGSDNAPTATRPGINDSDTNAPTPVANKRRKTIDEIVSEMERVNAVRKELARKGLLGGRGRGPFSVGDESRSRNGSRRDGNGMAMKTYGNSTSASTTSAAASGSGTLRRTSTAPIQVQGPPPPPSPSTSDDNVPVPPLLNATTSTTTRRASARLVANATAASLGRDTAQQPRTRARTNLKTRPAVAQSISHASRLRSSRNSQTRREQRQLPSIVKKKRTESSSRAQTKRSSATITAASSAAIATTPTTASVRMSGGKPIIPGPQPTEAFKKAAVADGLPVESEQETAPVTMADSPDRQRQTPRDTMDTAQDPPRRTPAPTTEHHAIPSISPAIPLAAGPGPRSLVPTVDPSVPQPFIIDPNPPHTHNNNPTTDPIGTSEPTNPTAPPALTAPPIDDFDIPLNPPELPPTQINTRLLPANQTYPGDAQIPQNFFNPPIYHDFVVQRTRPALPAIHSPMTSEDEDEKRYWKRKAKRAKGVNRTFYKSLRRGRGGGGDVGMMAEVPVGSESISASGSGPGSMFPSASSTSASGSSPSRGPDFNAWADELLRLLKPRIIDIVDEAVENAFMRRSRSAGGSRSGWLGPTSLPFEEEEESVDEESMDQGQGQDQPDEGVPVMDQGQPEDMQEHNDQDQVGSRKSDVSDRQLLEQDRPREVDPLDVARQTSLERDQLRVDEGERNSIAHPHTTSSPGQSHASASPPPHESTLQVTPLPPPQDTFGAGSHVHLLGTSPVDGRTKAQPPSRIVPGTRPGPVLGTSPEPMKFDPDMVEAMQREHERILANLRPLLTRGPSPMSEDSEDEGFDEPLGRPEDDDLDGDAQGDSDVGDVDVDATVMLEDMNQNVRQDGELNTAMDLDPHPEEASALAMNVNTPVNVTADDGQGNTPTSTLIGKPNAPPFMHN